MTRIRYDPPAFLIGWHIALTFAAVAIALPLIAFLLMAAGEFAATGNASWSEEAFYWLMGSVAFWRAVVGAMLALATGFSLTGFSRGEAA